MNPPYLTLHQKNHVLLAVCRALLARDPAVFRRGERWKPGGVHELRHHVTDLIALVRDSPHPTISQIKQVLCGKCQHRTNCGYCLVAEREDCVLLTHAAAIIHALREAMREIDPDWL